MSFPLKSCLQRSFLTRLLRTAGLSLVLMTASAVGAHSEDVIVQGANGANGADGFPDNRGETGGDGNPAPANAGSVTDPLNSATAIGGNGGTGGNSVFFAGNGGSGGAATATATTTNMSGSAGAEAASTGGTGGDSGFDPFGDGGGGIGGDAGAIAAATSATGNATASASATGGNGGHGDAQGGSGADATAASTATTTGAGDAQSTATATGGVPGGDFDIHNVISGSATATAKAVAEGGGKAIAMALATSPAGLEVLDSNKATSNAETTNGATAEALSIVVQGRSDFGQLGQATSTAKTSFAGMSIQTSISIPVPYYYPDGSTVTTLAIAQGGTSAVFAPPQDGSHFAVATVVPDNAFTTAVIDSFSATNVADALLSPDVKIFGVLFANTGAPTTFDFSFQGDLLLGNLDTDTVIDLGSNLGPNIDLPIDGDFVIGGVAEAVPETSTWAMMLLGFAGLGFAGYQSAPRWALRSA